MFYAGVLLACLPMVFFPNWVLYKTILTWQTLIWGQHWSQSHSRQLPSLGWCQKYIVLTLIVCNISVWSFQNVMLTRPAFPWALPPSHHLRALIVSGQAFNLEGNLNLALAQLNKVIILSHPYPDPMYCETHYWYLAETDLWCASVGLINIVYSEWLWSS